MNAQLELSASRPPCPKDRAQGEIVHDERHELASGSHQGPSATPWWSDAWSVWLRTEPSTPVSSPPAPAR